MLHLLTKLKNQLAVFTCNFSLHILTDAMKRPMLAGCFSVRAGTWDEHTSVNQESLGGMNSLLTQH